MLFVYCFYYFHEGCQYFWSQLLFVQAILFLCVSILCIIRFEFRLVYNELCGSSPSAAQLCAWIWFRFTCKLLQTWKKKQLPNKQM